MFPISFKVDLTKICLFFANNLRFFYMQILTDSGIFLVKIYEE